MATNHNLIQVRKIYAEHFQGDLGVDASNPDPKHIPVLAEKVRLLADAINILTYEIDKAQGN